MARKTIIHEFVEFMPETFGEGVVYISIPYCTAIHRCCCGCGNQVVTPISPTDWTISFNGVAISLSPSIGNWTFPCRSHYWIKGNRVIWEREDDEVKTAPHNDGETNNHRQQKRESTKRNESKPRESKSTMKQRIKKWWRGKR